MWREAHNIPEDELIFLGMSSSSEMHISPACAALLMGVLVMPIGTETTQRNEKN